MTLLERCADAADVDLLDVAAVLRAVADEILEHHHRGTAREVAQLLLEAAGTVEEPEPDDPKDWDDHPSLTAQERNPNLR